MSNPNRWSNSKLYTLEQCGEKFRRVYMENERPPANLAMIRGRAAHSVAAEVHRRLRDTIDHIPNLGPDDRVTAMPSEEAADLAATEFAEAATEQEVRLQPEEKEIGATKAVGNAKDFAVDVSKHYVTVPAPFMRPVAVERTIELRPPGTDVTLIARIDLIDKVTTLKTDEKGTVVPQGEVVRDLKFSGKSPNASMAASSQQLSMYALARMGEVGALPEKLALDVIVRTPKRHTLTHVILPTERTFDDVVVITNRINTAIEAVKAGVFVPTDPSNWWCSRRYCAFFDSCKYVNAKRQ